jgi:hypothetical protein
MQEMEEAEAEGGEMEEEERDEAMEEVKGEGIESTGNGVMRIPEEEDLDKTGVEAQEEDGARRQPNKITTARTILGKEEAKLAKVRAEMKTRATVEGKRAVKIFANRRK